MRLRHLVSQWTDWQRIWCAANADADSLLKRLLILLLCLAGQVHVAQPLDRVGP